MKNIVVIGCGVTGLTTAYCLAKDNYNVTVISRNRYSDTTSSIAAAFWYPYKAEPMNKISLWSQMGLAKFRELANVPETGVVWHDFSELLLPGRDLPWWHNVVDSFRMEEDSVELPVGTRMVCHYRVPIIDSTLYLKYLYGCLENLAVHIVIEELSNFDIAFERASFVVNCSGLGSRQLAGDTDLHAARGQVLRIKRIDKHSALVDLSIEGKIAHVIPRIHDTVLGGTYEPNELDLVPNSATTQTIISNCQSSFPSLGKIEKEEILDVMCGLRPVRSSVRVEREAFQGKWLFHNYGHGGAGFTLSWGCAQDICHLVSEVSG